MIKIVPLREAFIPPVRATAFSAGYDLASPVAAQIAPGQTIKIPLGFFIEADASPASNYFFMVVSRSGLASKGIVVANAPGIIDFDYRGEVCVLLYNRGSDFYEINAGDRIAQLVIMRHEALEIEGAKTQNNVRGTGGFGSTGISEIQATRQGMLFDQSFYEGTSTV